MRSASDSTLINPRPAIHRITTTINATINKPLLAIHHNPVLINPRPAIQYNRHIFSNNTNLYANYYHIIWNIVWSVTKKLTYKECCCFHYCPHLTQCVSGPHECTRQVACKFVERFQQGARMWQTDDRPRYAEMCSYSQNHLQWQQFCLITAEINLWLTFFINLVESSPYDSFLTLIINQRPVLQNV